MMLRLVPVKKLWLIVLFVVTVTVILTWSGLTSLPEEKYIKTVNDELPMKIVEATTTASRVSQEPELPHTIGPQPVAGSWLEPTLTDGKVGEDAGGLAQSDCVDRHAERYGRPQDVFCSNLPKFEPHLKNPCFYDYLDNHVTGRSKKLRCIPYFYVIGMDKCGTTDLFNRLMQHPQVQGNAGFLNKEVQFWSWKLVGVRHLGYTNRSRTLEEYVSSFQKAADVIQDTNNTKLIAGDASPMYFYDFHGWDRIPQNWGLTHPRLLTPHLIKRFHQKAMPKLILQFRDPIKRLYSDYEFLNYGHSVADFHQAVVKAKAMMDDCLRFKSQFLCYNDLDLYLRLPVRIHTSCYSLFLKEWFRVFPRQAFHITRIEDYHHNMTAVLDSVFRFLGLDPLPDDEMKEIIGLKIAMKGRTKKEAILPETVAILKEYYEPCTKELAAMLNDDNYLWNT